MQTQRWADDELDVWPLLRELLAELFEIFSDMPSRREKEWDEANFGDPGVSNAVRRPSRNRWFRQFKIRDFHHIIRLSRLDQLGQCDQIGIRFSTATAVGNE